MDLTTQRRLLSTLTAGFIAFAGLSVIWSLGSVDHDDSQSDAPAVRRGIGKAVENQSQGDPDRERKTQADLSLSLQRPLYDPPKPPPPKPQPKPVVVRNPKPVKTARLDWTLNGTIIDSDHSVAILTDASGKTDIRAAGEEVELSPPGVLIRSIDSEKVTLDLRGTQSTLRLQHSFQSDGGANADRPNRRRDR